MRFAEYTCHSAVVEGILARDRTAAPEVRAPPEPAALAEVYPDPA